MSDRILAAGSFLPPGGGHSSTLVVARSGMGKTHQVLTQVMDSLSQQEPVVILDCGRTYRHFCEVIGGTYVRLQDGGRYESEHFGSAHLVVYEFEELTEPWSKGLPSIQDWVDTLSNGLVVVDEVWRVAKQYPALTGELYARVGQGAHYCVVGQSEEDVVAYRHIDGNVRLVTMTEFKN